jgi:hypothetical protein
VKNVYSINVSVNTIFIKFLFRPRWNVKNKGQFNEDKAESGATLCPEESGGWPTQPVSGKLYKN